MAGFFFTQDFDQDSARPRPRESRRRLCQAGLCAVTCRVMRRCGAMGVRAPLRVVRVGLRYKGDGGGKRGLWGFGEFGLGQRLGWAGKCLAKFIYTFFR